MRRRGAESLAICLAFVMCLSGCGETAEGSVTVAEETSIAVRARTPEQGDLAVSSTFVGTVSPQEEVSIIPLVSGEATEVNFEVGDYVEAGSVLLRIDDEAARLQLESAQLTKEGAELSAQRTLGSSQVLSNLTMESNISSIQYQIDMAQKQYEAAGDSVADAYEAKDDMQSALDQIKSSISEMESGYENMRSMAVTAKNYVYQDGAGVWRWVTEPEPDWKSLYYTSQEEEDAANGAGSTSTETTPPVVNSVPPAASSIMGENGSNAGENSNGNEINSSNGNGEDSSSGSEKEMEGTTISQEGSPGSSQETSASEESSTQDAGSEKSSEQSVQKSSQENPSEQESSQESSSGEESASARNTSAWKTVAVRSGAGQDYALTAERLRTHTWPGTAEALQMTCSGEEAVLIEVDNTGDTVPAKKSYAEYQKAYAEYQAKAAVVSSFRSAGYSAADVGEGRVDSSVSSYATQIASLRSQASTLESNLSTMDSNIDSAETSRSSTADSIDYYKDNLENAQTQYGIQNGQAYQDTAASLANQIAASDVSVASAMLQLENYVLTAPISGHIEQINVEDYGFVSAGNPVYVISNKDSMLITFYVSEQVKNQLAPGQSISLERSGRSYQAVITQVGQSVNAQTNLFEIQAATESNELANGVTVKITADTYKTSGALLVPFDAVHFEGEKAYVYCVEGDVAVKTEVQTGIYNEDQIEITQGLSKDSVVVESWSSQLGDGTPVRLVEEEE